MMNLLPITLLFASLFAGDPNQTTAKIDPNHITVNVQIVVPSQTDDRNIKNLQMAPPVLAPIYAKSDPNQVQEQRRAEFLERKRQIRDNYLLREYAMQFHRRMEGRQYLQQKARFYQDREFYYEYNYGPSNYYQGGSYSTTNSYSLVRGYSR